MKDIADFAPLNIHPEYGASATSFGGEAKPPPTGAGGKIIQDVLCQAVEGGLRPPTGRQAGKFWMNFT
ncbi:MAG: hypothetical protein KKH94_05710 [Candidatus Omnitrophica bacterium]|nr:hypothetical protein [Candidatus Omnitrophota bacterium]